MAEYIEREALDKALTVAAANDKDKNRRTWVKAICVLHDLQAADVAPVRHGRWIEYTKVIIPEPYNKWEQAWKCSECGFDDGFVDYNYCPNCGARMDGGDAGETD